MFGARPTSSGATNPTAGAAARLQLTSPASDGWAAQPSDLGHALDATPPQVRRPQAREAAAVALIQRGQHAVDAPVELGRRATWVRVARGTTAAMDQPMVRAGHGGSCVLKDTVQPEVPAGQVPPRNLAKSFSDKPLRAGYTATRSCEVSPKPTNSLR